MCLAIAAFHSLGHSVIQLPAQQQLRCSHNYSTAATDQASALLLLALLLL
jgi:hypothetical protein